MSMHPSRPPPLRTSSTYDDDDTFHSVGLNLLSLYEGLGMSAEQVILATLINPKQRVSFLEALCVRLDRSSISNQQLLQALDQTFGKALQDLVQAESKETAENGGVYCFYGNNPVAPRHTSTNVPRRLSHPSQQQHHLGGGRNAFPEQPEISMSSSGSSVMSLGGKSHHSHHSSGSNTGNKSKKTTPRRFFPDDCYSFFRSKRRVQNIDWSLAEAVKQVEHLQLDGMVTSPPATTSSKNTYEPPRSTTS